MERAFSIRRSLQFQSALTRPTTDDWLSVHRALFIDEREDQRVRRSSFRKGHLAAAKNSLARRKGSLARFSSRLLSLEQGEPLCIAAARTRPRTGVVLRLQKPPPHRLFRTPELRGARRDGGPLGRMVRQLLTDQSHRSITNLRTESMRLGFRHDAKCSRGGAACHPGAIHEADRVVCAQRLDLGRLDKLRPCNGARKRKNCARQHPMRALGNDPTIDARAYQSFLANFMEVSTNVCTIYKGGRKPRNVDAGNLRCDGHGGRRATGILAETVSTTVCSAHQSQRLETLRTRRKGFWGR